MVYDESLTFLNLPDPLTLLQKDGLMLISIWTKNLAFTQTIALVVAFLGLNQSPLYSQHLPEDGYSYDLPKAVATHRQTPPVCSFPVSGIDADAQIFVNEALESMHGFWFYDAEERLRTAIAAFPQNAMLYALAALNGSIFASGDLERGKAYMKKALAALYTGTMEADPKKEREVLWIKAIAVLYDENLKTDDAKTLHLEKLEALSKKYPKDLEALAFIALQTWFLRLMKCQILTPRSKTIS